ncbi:PIN domain-containing protein [Candidatus Synechococcus calcipolaris G9]|uniref:PIN domain-containing protein n=2 Tax=Synechococcus TaxID=1129 RepID=A0ABT6F2L2_9SYNE|nr:PIN domain-containing protein [Candidatus Synechococcus calcipolaris G9]
MQLALADLFRGKWTNEIHDEWMRNLAQNRPDITLEQLKRTKNLMNTHVRDCLITDYEWLMPCLELPDPKDRHVLAAAIHGKVDVIVTFNLKDFPPKALAPHNIELQHPDDFLAFLIDLRPMKVVQALTIVQERLQNPPKTLEDYLNNLLGQGLPISVSMLRAIFYES